MMKIESASAKKTWSTHNANPETKPEATQDLYLACLSFLILLFVAVADATFKM